MTRGERWAAHGAVALVGGTGLVVAWMQYALPPPDLFAVANHPWQPTVQHLHILTAPMLVWILGHLWVTHALAHRRAGIVVGRRSGNAMLWTAIPMIASGYLIQVAVSPGWRNAWIAVHLVSSTAWLAGYLSHLLRHRRGPKRPLRQPTPTTPWTLP
jgi:hypothetical protein